MNRKLFAIVLSFAGLAVAGTAGNPWSPSSPVTPAVAADSQQVQGTCDVAADITIDSVDTARVPPGCCSSNCNTDRDCNKICGKGNCVCIVESSCCSRCTW